MRRSNGDGPGLLHFERFGASGGIVHAISTRHGGVSTGQFATLNVATSGGDAVAAVEENRWRILDALGLDPLDLAMMGQVHGTRCEVVGPRTSPERRPYARQTDVLLTNVPGTALMALCADCAPVLLWDPIQRAVAVAHAGWRGALAGVVAAAMTALGREFGSRPADLQAAIGPCIGACCFEVRDAVLGPLYQQVPVADRLDRRDGEGRHYLDLPGLLQWQLESAGVPPAQVEPAGLCTACDPATFFSHRAEQGRTGRFGALIALV